MQAFSRVSQPVRLLGGFAVAGVAYSATVKAHTEELGTISSLHEQSKQVCLLCEAYVLAVCSREAFGQTGMHATLAPAVLPAYALHR